MTLPFLCLETNACNNLLCLCHMGDFYDIIKLVGSIKEIVHPFFNPILARKPLPLPLKAIPWLFL